MSEIQFVKEHQHMTRTAQILWNTTTDAYTVYCFCCGEESQTPSFESQADADAWAMAWVNKQASLTEFELEESTECACS
jgi:hypothetical protein